jgi:hypothetical protein
MQKRKLGNLEIPAIGLGLGYARRQSLIRKNGIADT